MLEELDQHEPKVCVSSSAALVDMFIRGLPSGSAGAELAQSSFVDRVRGKY